LTEYNIGYARADYNLLLNIQTARDLLLSDCVHNVHNGIKILGDGVERFNTPIYVVVSRASKSAIEAIEKSGGKVVCKYYNALSLQDCVEGRADRVSAAPTRREDIVWYGNHNKRGFMSCRTLKNLRDMPFVEERWKLLSKELGRWEKQGGLVKE